MKDEFLSLSEKDTRAYAYKLGKELPSCALVTFSGELGAGKTAFIKGLAAGYADISLHEVSSPTFSYLHIYENMRSVYHFDLYRLKDARDFFDAGFDEYLKMNGVTCIEWAERIMPELPALSLSHWIDIQITHKTPTSRLIARNRRA